MKKTLLPLFLLGCSSVLQAQLLLDQTFGTNGMVNTNYLYADTHYCYWQNQEDFILLGASNLKRIDQDGIPDNTMNNNTILGFPPYGLDSVKPIENSIFMSGSAIGPAVPQFNYIDGAVYKFDTNGYLDASFGVNGIATFNLGEDEHVRDFAITAEGKIICAVEKTSPSWSKLALVRLNADGSLDLTFDPSGYKEYYLFPEKTYPEELRIGDDGSLYLWSTGILSSQAAQSKVTKFTANGNLDTSFGIDGSFPISGQGYQRQRFFIQNGKGWFLTYNPEHSLIQCIDLATGIAESATFYGEVLTDFVVNQDKSILAYGIEDCPVGPCSNSLFVVRFTPQGQIDTAFGDQGKFRFQFTYTSRNAGGMMFLKDNKLTIAGGTEVLGTNAPDFNFKMVRFVVDTQFLGTTESAKESLSVFPNPVSEALNIRVGNDFSNMVNVKITNLLAQVVYNKSHDLHPISIDTGDWNSGLYIAKLSDNSGHEQSVKFLKK
ncbi:T9SS type A sorting domain-containing protein [Flavobacterium sp.]|uniref:T9SS type A sorting domain-containing protein n=1 Tax=Flavobacterium sp. TaxID=239 RepID=UPI0039E41BB6